MFHSDIKAGIMELPYYSSYFRCDMTWAYNIEVWILITERFVKKKAPTPPGMHSREESIASNESSPGQISDDIDEGEPASPKQKPTKPPRNLVSSDVYIDQGPNFFRDGRTPGSHATSVFTSKMFIQFFRVTT